MVDQITTKIRYENTNTYEFASHFYINLIKLCDFQCFIHPHYRKHGKIEIKKINDKITYTKLHNGSSTYLAPRLRGGYAPSISNVTYEYF